MYNRTSFSKSQYESYCQVPDYYISLFLFSIGLEAGDSYLFTDGIVGINAEDDVIPHLNFLRDLEMEIAPYFQLGITFQRNSQTRFFADLRVAQNVLPISKGTKDIYFYDTTAGPSFQANHPCEIGINLGIGW